jgi:hypothetical protein
MRLDFRRPKFATHGGGNAGVPLRDHRVQLLIRKAALYDQAIARAKQVTKAPIPQVQRPGTVRPRGAADEQQISRIQQELATASGARAVKLAIQLHQARRSAGM